MPIEMTKNKPKVLFFAAIILAPVRHIPKMAFMSEYIRLFLVKSVLESPNIMKNMVPIMRRSGNFRYIETSFDRTKPKKMAPRIEVMKNDDLKNLLSFDWRK